MRPPPRRRPPSGRPWLSGATTCSAVCAVWSIRRAVTSRVPPPYRPGRQQECRRRVGRQDRQAVVGGEGVTAALGQAVVLHLRVVRQALLDGEGRRRGDPQEPL